MKRIPFKFTMPEPAEQDVHEACVKMLKACLKPPAFWACYPAGIIELSSQQMAKLARSGLRRGMPDFQIYYEGLVFGLELKRPGGKLSKTYIDKTKHGALVLREGQEDVFKQLHAAGMAIAVVHSVDEMMAQIRRWGLPISGQVM